MCAYSSIHKVLFRADANFPVSLPVPRSGRGNVSRSAPRDVDRLGNRSWRAARGGACAPRMRFKDLERGVSIICELEYSPADTLTLNQRIPGSMATAAFTATVETLTED